MMVLKAENIHKAFGMKVLFEELELAISQGQKVGLIAKNGSGKTTLINILSGKDAPDKGEVTLAKDLRFGMLRQDVEVPMHLSVEQTLFEGEHPALQAMESYEAALQKVQDQPEDEAANQDLQKAMDLMDTHQAWDFEAQFKEILGKLRIYDLKQSIGNMSGGEQKRVMLARALIRQPEFLIMDEPTNHLDLDMIEWLENHLQKANLSLLLITHDRYFLDHVVDEIIELENRKLYRYTGKYSYYLEKKAERLANEKASAERAGKLMKSELAWMRTQPRARTTKSKARIERFGDIEQKAAAGPRDKKVKLDVKMQRLGSKIIEFHHVGKIFDNRHMLHDFSYKFQKGEKVGIIGKNGTGKSTFLNLLTGKLEPDTGKVVQGETVQFGFFEQTYPDFPEDKKVIDIVRDVAEVIPLSDGTSLSASQMLQRFLFEPGVQYDFAYKLSGGEKRRLHLLLVLMKNPNFLILDEPTNDLDIPTLNVLEDFLVDFKGCLVIVSHDRFFMDKMVDHLFVFNDVGDGKIKDYPGNYTQYKYYLKDQEKKVRADKKAQSKTKQAAKSEKPIAKQNNKALSYKERQRLKDLETEIPQCQKALEAIALKMNEAQNQSFEEVQKLSEAHQKLSSELEMKEMEWLELEEKKENS